MTSGLGRLAAFVPQDRLRALAGGPPVPDRGTGSVLVADVSGFSALTDSLARTHGPREGAEELSVLLDRVFGALVDSVDAFGGSVIWFAGDSVTCSFDGDDGSRAVACGRRMQAVSGAAGVPPAVAVLGPPSVKVAIATGVVRRFLVGDPAIQNLEVVAGPAVELVAAVERHARGGEIVVDAATAARLGERLPVTAWRDAGRCAVIGAAPEGATAAGPASDEAGLGPKSKPAPGEVATDPWVLPAVRDRLRGGGDAFLAEIRPLVAMFIELTDLDLAADDAAARLDRDVRTAQEVLAAHGGSLFGVFVDAKGVHLCSGFGAPVAYDDLDARAAAAALATRDALAAGGGRVGVGISRGHAYCGSFGGATRRSYSPVGSHVNWAARFMQFAGAGRIVVGQRVADALTGRFALDDLGPTLVKGSSVPLPVHALRGPLADPAPGARPAAPVVGRVAERAALGERLRLLRGGTGGTVVVEGEPGIGKSRLLADLCDGAARAGVRTLLARGDAVTRSVPYHAWRPAFAALAGPDQAGLRVLLDRDGPDDPVRLLPLLAPVLPGDVADTAATAGLTGQVRAERTRELCDALLRAAAAREPLLVVVEDAHWLDSASWALVHRLVATPAPLLLVLAMRSDPAAAEVAAVAVAAERMVLGPLDDADVLALASATVSAPALPAAVAALVGRNAGGNPFFVEQLVRSLHEDGVIRVTAGACEVAPDAPDLSTLSYPDTVEGVVMSRIDQLDPEQELALKVASVWGETFRPADLRAVHPMPEHLPRLADDLDALARRDLTRRTGTTYSFRHAITREVAYRRMLGSQRAALHRRIGEWCAGRDEPGSTQLLAHHWYHAAKDGHGGRDTAGPAVDHLCRAADEVIAADAHAEAPEYFQRALDLLLRDPESTDRDRREMHIRTRLAWTLVARRGYGDADVVAAYRRADELSTRVGVSADLTLILYGLFSFHAFRAEYGPARDVAQRLVGLGTRLDDAGALSVGHQSAGIAALLGGDVPASRGHLHRSRDLADRLGGTVFPGFPTLELRTYTGAWIALAEHLLGRPDAALEAYTDTLAITAEQPYTRAFVLAFGGLHQLRGDVARVRADADELDALADRYSFALFGALARVYRGWALAMGGERWGIGMIEDGLIMPRMAKADSTLPRFLAMLAQARLAVGQHGAALEAAAEGLAMVAAAGAGSWEAELLRVQADALAAGGSDDDVVGERLARALAAARAGGIPWWELRVLATARRLGLDADPARLGALETTFGEAVSSAR